MQRIVVDLIGQDRIEIEFAPESLPKMKVYGCKSLLTLLKEMKQEFGNDLRNWKLPVGNSHSELLVREAMMKFRGDWRTQYSEAELCHCRGVLTETVEQAIINGAHTAEAVSARTSASTACGTCRETVEKLISYRLRC